LQYNTDLFEEKTIRQMAEHLLGLLEDIVEKVDTPLSRLKLRQSDRAEAMLRVLEGSKTTGKQFTCVHDRIAAMAARQGEEIALVDAASSMTYGELFRKTGQIAAYLRDIGVTEEMPIGVCLPRTNLMVPVLLGVMSAGASYVPMDPDFPAESLAYMLDDVAAPILLTTKETAFEAPAGVRTIHVDSILASQQPTVEFDPIDPDRLAYTIYTSGSTGRPKGVQISHLGLANFLDSMADEPGLTRSDRLLAVTTISFDIAALELYLPLMQGGRVVIADKAATVDPQSLCTMLREHEITTMQATPSTWQMLIHWGWQGQSGLRALSGGEALPVSLASALLGYGLPLWNLYGPTETTIWSTATEIASDMIAGQPSVPLGTPIANTSLCLLDRGFQEVSVGIAGELHIGGDGLARGYAKRPALTAERFLPDPRSQMPGARLYRTGDRTRLRHHKDGLQLNYLGRTDFQVKIRGRRIELGEIEATLDSMSLIRESVVTLHDPGSAKARLVAWLIAEDGEMPDHASCVAFLQGKLPRHMIPDRFAVLDSFPMTANRKIDRGALSRRGLPTRPYRQENVLRPRNRHELAIAAIFSRFLGLEQVAIDDDFFALGGHSLLAVPMIAEINETLNCQLPLRILFENPTVMALARWAAQEADADFDPCLVPMRAVGEETPLFFVHPVGGTPFCYQALVDLLPNRHPVYAFQAPGIEGGPVVDDLDTLVTRYLKALEHEVPEGPVFLAGWSLGGVIAWELAARLTAKGRTVRVFLLDTGFPSVQKTAPDERSLLTSFVAGGDPVFVEIVNGMDTNEDLETILETVSDRAKASGLLPETTTVQQVERYFSVFKANNLATWNYRPSQIRAELVLLHVSSQRPVSIEAWVDLATEGSKTFALPGTHENMVLFPNVSHLASAMSECLRRAPCDKTTEEGED